MAKQEDKPVKEPQSAGQDKPAKEPKAKKDKPPAGGEAKASAKSPKESKGAGKGDKGDKGKGGEKKAKDKEAARPQEPARQAAPPRLREKYRKDVTASLTRRFGYSNPMQVPRLTKVVVNMGLGAAVANPKLIDSAVEETAQITGQKPVVTRAKKAISNYKLRTGIPIGVMVTLRRERMWEFLDRLISFALPRVRDFKGVNAKGFDGRGNYTLGLREQIIFPEIDYDKMDTIKGMNVSIVTTAKTDEEGRALLSELGMPFRS